ncbi:MAG: metallophosphoesterase [Ruminococcus sp.]|nr:metallophosphoesterase [Ruminococcus sp.]MDY3896326.1 metallophosphoesterase [Candidatus Fimenecus sp.]
MFKIIAVMAAAVSAAAVILLLLWVISRAGLKKQSRIFKSGTWKEINWDANDEFDPDDETLYHTMDFDRDREFRLLMMTDIHYRNDGWYGIWTINFQNRKTDRDLRYLVKETNPDLIIVSGDVESGSLNDDNYRNFTDMMDSLGVPWTLVFGNHDAETRADKPAVMNIVEKGKNTVFRQGPTNLGITKDRVIDDRVYDEKTDKYAGGLGNTVINLRDKKTGIIYYSFILADTGDWQNMYGNMKSKNRLSVGPRPFSRVGVGLTDRQIEWYKYIIDGLTKYNRKKGGDTPETMFISHIAPNVCDYAAILSQYDNSYGGCYTSGGYPYNDLPFSTDAEWSSPADRPYIEFDESNKELTSDPKIAARLKFYNENAVEKAGNDAISQYLCLADNDKRGDYISGKNEKYPNPMHLSQLVKIIDREYPTHRENDLFIRAVYEKGSTKRMASGHNHCDGYEVFFDGITYNSVVKTGDIYVDRDWDNGNRGGSLFKIIGTNDGVSVKSEAVFTRNTGGKSARYPRPVTDWQE